MNLPTLRLTKEELSHFDEAIQKEWLIANGLGSYASSTVLGINTRKYHGLLVAALHPPGDRTVCLAKLDEEVSVGNNVYLFGATEFQGAIFPDGYKFLKEFLVSPFPCYVYSAGKVTAKKTLFMPSGKNVVVAVYKVLNRSDSDVKFRVTPLTTCRHFHSVVNLWSKQLEFSQKNHPQEVQLTFNRPKAAITVCATNGEFHEKPSWIERLLYREEAMRGESSIDDCYQPGYFEVTVSGKSGEKFAIMAAAGESIQENTRVLDEIGVTLSDIKRMFNREIYTRSIALSNFYGLNKTVPPSDWLSWILMAANSFIVEGFNDRKSVIAGYPWFESWGRDTFISLPGLLLITGRFEDAKDVLLDFSRYCRQGLIPNYLQDQSGEPTYNTVDASLWFVNAVLQYLKYTGDIHFVQTQLWETLKGIVENHVEGTDFGIHVDTDGLLVHGARLTWMDAEADGNAVTPRKGKAVEIQALWFNALKTGQLLAARFAEKKLAETYAALSEKAQASFNMKFWNSEKSCLFDVVGESGVDASLRPNQVIAAALDFTMLDKSKNAKVVKIVQRELLVPCGLRTLEPSDPNYKGVYAGDRKSRDQAYHSGTVWPWLLGSFTSAFLKTRGYTAQNSEYAFRNFLEPLFTRQIQQACLGTVNEIFDGDASYAPRGCISQAWSVAEPLRAYIEDVLRVKPKYEKEVLKSSKA
jgi:predicted glycogen debranching enzyme